MKNLGDWWLYKYMCYNSMYEIVREYLKNQDFSYFYLASVFLMPWNMMGGNLLVTLNLVGDHKKFIMSVCKGKM